MAVKVQAPARKPRQGGIKAIVGEFITEPRLGIADPAWEDSECGFPNATRAGCMDDTFPLSYEEVVLTDEGSGDVYTVNRSGNTVTIHVVFDDQGERTGVTIPHPPAGETNHVEPVTGGTLTIWAVFGYAVVSGTPTGEDTFSYTADGPGLGGYYPPFESDGVTQYGLIGPVFALYKSTGCFLGGDSDGSYLEQARRSLEASEDRSVEAVLWEWAAAAASPGSAGTLIDAIAAAEEYADTAYVYRPVLVMSRGAAQVAFEKGALKEKDGVLHTGSGTPVLATGSVPDDEEDTVAIIGQPAVYAGEIVTGGAPHLALNREVALAQRLYGIGVDCDFRYAVNVTA